MTAYYYGQIGNHMSQFLKSLQPKQHVEAVETTPATPATVTE